MTLNDVLVAFEWWEVHGVDVDLREQGSWSCDDWENDDLSKLTFLAEVA